MLRFSEFFVFAECNSQIFVIRDKHAGRGVAETWTLET